LNIIPELSLSSSQESLLAMRWVGLLYGNVDISMAATGGIHTAEDALRMLMSGANVCHLCSVLLKNGPGYLAKILAEMESWMEAHEYESVSQLIGSASKLNAVEPAAFERCNYLQVLRSYQG